MLQQTTERLIWINQLVSNLFAGRMQNMHFAGLKTERWSMDNVREKIQLMCMLSYICTEEEPN